jgi:hypothetical protein
MLIKIAHINPKFLERISKKRKQTWIPRIANRIKLVRTGEEVLNRLFFRESPMRKTEIRLAYALSILGLLMINLALVCYLLYAPSIERPWDVYPYREFAALPLGLGIGLLAIGAFCLWLATEERT